MASCSNHSSTDVSSKDNIVNKESELDTDEVIKSYTPTAKSSQIVISQKDVLMNEAVTISNDFYNNLKSKNYQGANKYLHPDAIEATPTSEWIKIYQQAQSKKGNLGYIKMYDYGVKCKMNGGNGLGDYAELIFDAQYKDGNFREKLTFYRKDSTESVKIMAYQYDEIVDRVFVSKLFR